MRADSVERGSGSVYAVAILAATALLGTCGVALSSALVQATAAQVAANQAALAASDIARGIVPGIPCRVAGTLVREAGFRMSRCTIDAGEASVWVAGSWWGLDISKRARAGPSPHPVFGDGG